MESRSEWRGSVEVGTVVFEGRELSNLGACVAPDMSTVTGYVQTYPWTMAHYLTTWDGEFMYVVVRPVSRWRVRSGVGTHMFAYSAVIGGVRYHGRGFGPGCVLRLHRSKRAQA